MASSSRFESFVTGLADLESPVRAYAAFEQLILRLLELYVDENGGRIEFEAGRRAVASRLQFDALMPFGIDDLEGPTVIEIKYTRNPTKSFLTRLNDFAGQLSLAAARSGIRSGILIHNSRLSEKQRAHVGRFLAELPPVPAIRIWGIEELTELSSRYPQVDEWLAEAETAFGGILLQSVREELSGPEPDWRSSTEIHVGELRELYWSEELTLFLGAGVSADAGVPSWDELLAGLYLSLAAQEFGQDIGGENELIPLATIVKGLGGGTPLLTARYLRSGLETSGNEGKRFEQHVAEILYKGLRSSKGPLLPAIAQVCQPHRRGAPIRSVVTFNFDDLLEEELSARGVSHHSIYLADDYPLRDELPIYHVHGFLPRTREDFPRIDESLLALSEEGYHAVYRDPYHWSNIVQLNALRETACVFLGLSLTDPNLRRLLEIPDRSDKPRHYAFMRRTSEADVRLLAEEHKVNGDYLAASSVESLLRTHHVLLEHVLRELGITPIWFSDHDELPSLLVGLVERGS